MTQDANGAVLAPSTVRDLISCVDALPSVLGTVCDSVTYPWDDAPTIRCRTYLDKRQLDLDMVNGIVTGRALFDADDMLRSEGYNPQLNCGAQTWLEWHIPNKKVSESP